MADHNQLILIPNLKYRTQMFSQQKASNHVNSLNIPCVCDERSQLFEMSTSHLEHTKINYFAPFYWRFSSQC